MSAEFRIVLQPEAYEGMESGYRYIEEQSSERAQKWARELMEAINSLKTFPRRCPVAPENDYFPAEIRQLLYGKRSGIYRILFTIQDDVVSILHIRHGAQEVLKPVPLDETISD